MNPSSTPSDDGSDRHNPGWEAVAVVNPSSTPSDDGSDRHNQGSEPVAGVNPSSTPSDDGSDRHNQGSEPVAAVNPSSTPSDDGSDLHNQEPNDLHISETTELFIQESSGDNRSLNLHDLEYDGYTIGMALSSPLFTQEREEPAGRRQAYHSLEQGLLSSQSLSVGRRD